MNEVLMGYKYLYIYMGFTDIYGALLKFSVLLMRS